MWGEVSSLSSFMHTHAHIHTHTHTHTHSSAADVELRNNCYFRTKHHHTSWMYPSNILPSPSLPPSLPPSLSFPPSLPLPFPTPFLPSSPSLRPSLPPSLPPSLSLFSFPFPLLPLSPSFPPSLNSFQLALSYPVDQLNGRAKFDKSKKTLTITLPILPLPSSPLPPHTFATEVE